MARSSSIKHHWTHQENAELLYCYFTVDPGTRGYQARLFDLLHERSPGHEDFTEQRLAGQVSSIMRRKVFSQLELEEIKSRVSSTTVKPPAIDVSPRLDVSVDPSAPCSPIPAVISDLEPNSELPTVDDDLVTLREEILSKVTSLQGTSKLRLPSLQSMPHNRFKERLCDVNKVLCTIPTCNLNEVHHLMYCDAMVIVQHCGLEVQPLQRIPPSSGPPAWKTQLTSNIQRLQGDLNRLHSLKDGQLHRRSTRSKLFEQYQIYCDSDIDIACEYVSQRICA